MLHLQRSIKKYINVKNPENFKKFLILNVILVITNKHSSQKNEI